MRRAFAHVHTPSPDTSAAHGARAAGIRHGTRRVRADEHRRLHFSARAFQHAHRIPRARRTPHSHRSAAFDDNGTSPNRGAGRCSIPEACTRWAAVVTASPKAPSRWSTTALPSWRHHARRAEAGRRRTYQQGRRRRDEGGPLHPRRYVDLARRGDHLVGQQGPQDHRRAGRAGIPGFASLNCSLAVDEGAQRSGAPPARRARADSRRT